MVSTDTQEWTIYNPKNGKIDYITHEEFKNLLDKGGVKLKGGYIAVNVYHNSKKVWIDAIINSDYFK